MFIVRLVSQVSLAGVVSSASVFIYNSTEHWRMARNIQQGKLFSPQKEGLDPSLCQFPLSNIKRVVMGAPNKFCGIVGPKATGKTSTLELFSMDIKNIVYVTMNHTDNVYDELHECLKKSVYHLPWFLDRMRFDSSLTTKDITNKVFRAVKKNSPLGTPVTAVIDVSLTKPSDINYQVPSLSSPKYERSFIRQVKQLVDSGVMQCLFAATEELSFQDEAVREPRLSLFMASELSISNSKKFLQKFGVVANYEVKELLSAIPRTFTNLQDFANSEDRKAFVDNNFVNEMTKIKESISVIGHENAKNIYQQALTQGDIDSLDLYNLHISKHDFMKVFVEPNIFTVTLYQTYKFQFDATAAAARTVLEKKLPDINLEP